MIGSNSCARRPLPESAFDYAIEQLWAAQGLSAPLADELVPDRWEAWTLAEPDVPVSRLAAFTEGGSLCGPRFDEAMWCEIGVAAANLRSPVFIVPDPLARAGDPFLESAPVEYETVKDGVYYVSRGPDLAGWAAVWRQASSGVARFGVLTTVDFAAIELVGDAFASVIAGTRMVIVSAYDEDGALFFERLPASG